MISSGASRDDGLQEHLSPRDATARIVLTGSESTGKTTLARALATALGSIWVPEYSREFAQRIGRALSAQDVEAIANGQVDGEEAGVLALVQRPRGIPPAREEIVLDTDLVSTTLYSTFYYGQCPAWILDVARARLGDLYLLCLPDIPWQADSVRDQPDARRELHARFSERLAEWNATVVEVGGVGAHRLEHAVAAVRGWRAALAQQIGSPKPDAGRR